MNTFSLPRRHCLLALGACALTPLVAHAASGLPGDSVYRLRTALEDQDGRAFELASLQGRVVLASMFYSSCEMVCPMIFETLHMTLKRLPKAEQAAVRVVMISFDPGRDTVPVLKRTAQAHGCDDRWTVARCRNDSDARSVAAVLGVQYRRLDSGEFNHSSTVELLDRQGRVAARSGQLGAVDNALLGAVHRASAAT
jgi:protein SCO1